VLPFYLGEFEPERGKPRTGALLQAARWFADRGVRLKGHPLVWHTVGPKWWLGMSAEQTEAVLRARISRDVGDFAGLVDTWDAINEVVIMPVFKAEANAVTDLAWAKGRIGIVRMAFEQARAANPRATLLLNDFDLSSAYECLIEGVLEAGIEVDGIGLQTHMHQGYRGAEAVGAILERFARFGLPLHLTETSLVSGELMPPEFDDLNDYQVDSWPSTPEGEERQAREIEQHYRSALAHPAVVSVTYWGLTDRTAWLGAPSGLLRADGSAKPAYGALRQLIKGEWWLPETGASTDEHGCVRLRGFYGTYRVRARGMEGEFALAQQGAGTAFAQVSTPSIRIELR
jgi:GH35 family endo-1,4-beta-xylanase